MRKRIAIGAALVAVMLSIVGPPFVTWSVRPYPPLRACPGSMIAVTASLRLDGPSRGGDAWGRDRWHFRPLNQGRVVTQHQPFQPSEGKVYAHTTKPAKHTGTKEQSLLQSMLFAGAVFRSKSWAQLSPDPWEATVLDRGRIALTMRICHLCLLKLLFRTHHSSAFFLSSPPKLL